MNWPLSWLSDNFVQSQDLWMLTCFCITSSGVPQTVVVEEPGLKNPTGLEAPIPCPHGPEDQQEMRMGGSLQIPALAYRNKPHIIQSWEGAMASLAPDNHEGTWSWGGGSLEKPISQVGGLRPRPPQAGRT